MRLIKKAETSRKIIDIQDIDSTDTKFKIELM